MELKRTYSFNTCVTAPFDANGQFDDDAHTALVLPIRHRIMTSCDGLTGCHISRYSIEIRLLDEVVSEDEVTRHIEEATAWAADQKDLFPMRGDKTPKATLDKRTRRPSYNRRMIVRFPSYVTAFTPMKGKVGFDDAKFLAVIHPLIEQLTNHDGVVGYDISLGSAAIDFDTRYTTPEEVEAHLTQVLEEAFFSKDDHCFPFADTDEVPEFTFELDES